MARQSERGRALSGDQNCYDRETERSELKALQHIRIWESGPRDTPPIGSEVVEIKYRFNKF